MNALQTLVEGTGKSSTKPTEGSRLQKEPDLIRRLLTSKFRALQCMPQTLNNVKRLLSLYVFSSLTIFDSKAHGILNSKSKIKDGIQNLY